MLWGGWIKDRFSTKETRTYTDDEEARSLGMKSIQETKTNLNSKKLLLEQIQAVEEASANG